jgi:predicted HicB family RNase H-like nuclease
MILNVSQQTEARLTEEAQRQGVSVDALIERIMSERTASARAQKHEPETPDRF